MHQYLTTTGDTYWVQRLSSPVPDSRNNGHDLPDTAPTKDRYNLSIVEVLATSGVAPTWTLSGSRVLPAWDSARRSHLGGYIVRDDYGRQQWELQLYRPRQRLVHGDADQERNQLQPGQSACHHQRRESYGNRQLHRPDRDLHNRRQYYSRQLGNGRNCCAGRCLLSATTTADGNANYSFTGLANGSYTVTPTKSGTSFSPSNQPVMINGANQGGVSFTAQAAAYAISGTISPVSLGAGATVALGGASSGTTTTDSNGNYSFAGLANGS